jgi:hypothetical protein
MAQDAIGNGGVKGGGRCRLCGAILAAARNAKRMRALRSGADGPQRRAHGIWRAALEGHLQLVPGGRGGGREDEAPGLG